MVYLQETRSTMNKLNRHMLENNQTEIVEETLGAEHTYERHNQGVIAVAMDALNTPRLAPALNEKTSACDFDLPKETFSVLNIKVFTFNSITNFACL